MATQIDMPIAAEMIRKPEPDAFMVLVDRVSQYGPDVLGKALDAFERFQAMQAKAAYEEAMAVFKKNIPSIVKRKVADMNGKYQYKYAELAADICEKLDPCLEAHGFRYTWTTRPNEKGVVVACVITHVKGHSEETLMPPAPHDASGGKNSIQAIGSTLSYLQRYSLLMALGIAPKNTDTDGVPPKPNGAGMDAKEREQRIAHFDKCQSYQEIDAHYKASFAEAHNAKDQDAKDAFIAAKKTAYARLRDKQ